MACDAVEVVVADSFHDHSTADADDEPVMVHDDFGSVANGDAALLGADDGTEVADGSPVRRPVGSWMGADRNSCRGCYAAVYPDDTGDDLIAVHGAAAEASWHRWVGLAAAAGEVDSELGRASANESSELLVVLPCSVVVAVDTVAGDADGVFRCRRLGHLRPLMRHCWGHLCHRPVVQRAAMVRSPAEVQSEAESALVPSH